MNAPERLQYKEKKKRRRKILVLLGLLLFLSFIARTLFGEAGILVNMRVNAEHRRLQQEQETLEQENMRLMRELKALKNSKRKIEEIGRGEFGFGRPGELIFYFPEDAEKAIQRYEHPYKNPPRGSVQ